MNSIKHLDNAKITILTELYNKDYSKSDLSTMGGYILDKYDEFANVFDTSLLFYDAFLQLKELGLVDSSSNIHKKLGVVNPRITASGHKQLSNVFVKSDFENFMNESSNQINIQESIKIEKKENKLKNTIVEKVIENGVEKVVNYILSSGTPVYHVVMQVIKSFM